MPSRLQDLADRLVAMEMDAVSGVQAYKHPFIASETLPYFTNGLTTSTPNYNSGRQMVRRDVIAVVRYIVAHFTEGYYGDNVDRIYQDTPVIEDYFDSHRYLTTPTNPNPPTCLHPDGMILQPTQVLVVMENSGIGTKQVGSVFTLLIPFNIDIQEDW